MRFRVAWLFAVATAAWATPASANKCALAPIELPAARVDAILNESIRAQRNERIAELLNYWMAHCGDVRQRASESVVVQLTRLLDSHELRFVAVEMLVDLDRNALESVRPSLEVALADERTRYDSSVRANGGLAWNLHMFPAMQCIEHKLETGEIDQELCDGVLSARGPEGPQQAEQGPQ